MYGEMIRMEPSINSFVSKNWFQEKRTDENAKVKAVFVLKHDRTIIRDMDRELINRSSPSSSSYGKWLKHEEIASRLAPSQDRLDVVTNYINSFSGVEKVEFSTFKDMVFVTMPVKVANEMLITEFASFRSVSRRDIGILRITKPYHLPKEVAEVVSLVDDILRFPSIRSPPKKTVSEELTTQSDPEFDSCGSKCSGMTTPAVLKKAYSIEPVTSVSPGNSMAVAEFIQQFYDQADLDAFSKACGVTANVDTNIGGNTEAVCLNTGGCYEALLDIEYIEAVSNPIPLTVIYIAQYSLLNWINEVLSLSNPPLVHSVSYGDDEVQQVSLEYMESVNDQFLAAGLMGLSILFASGDQGVWGRSGVGRVFHPDFPSASPYVTAVGGTDFSVKSVIGDETAWTCSGGGFSTIFSIPSWQADAVSGYLSKAEAAGLLPASSYYNASGRAYPDVSALAGQRNPYCITYHGGAFGNLAGTSASTPVFAAMVAQLNNIRLANGKSSMGFLNPFIYSNPQCFKDVNDQSQNNCYYGTTGFKTLDGWDPATGMGTPNYACLSKLV